jgi:hypothetical protein
VVVLPEVTSPEAALTGSDGSNVTGSHRIRSDVTEVCSAHAWIFSSTVFRYFFFGFPRFFLTIVVVQNVFEKIRAKGSAHAQIFSRTVFDFPRFFLTMVAVQVVQ